jgi:hypothetical protein
MPKVEGLKKLEQRIKQMIKEARKDTTGGKGSAVVGFTQFYAVFVHENLTANHPKGGEAKYLERPFRNIKPQAAQLVQQAMKKGVSMPQALLLLALRVQREAMLLVPIDTGALRASAFTRLERKGPEKYPVTNKKAPPPKVKKGTK